VSLVVKAFSPSVEKLNTFSVSFRRKIFLFQNPKTATNSDKVIYNFQFHRQLRKPVGGFL